MKQSIFTQKRLAAIIFAAALSACGGGGGGSSSGGGGAGPVSPSPPPPPPPANAAPSAQATATPASLHEGQPFTLDASASTDADGDTLTFDWSQISGPAVPLPSTNQSVLELSAAEVTEDTEAVFRVTVSDGETTSTADVSVTFENIAQTPTFSAPLSLVAVASFEDRPIGLTQFRSSPVLVTEAEPGGEQAVSAVDLQTSNTTASVTFTPLIPGTFPAPSALNSVNGQWGSQFSGLAVAQEERGEVRVYVEDPDGSQPLLLSQTFEVDSPCAVETNSVEFSFPHIVIGQRDMGFTVYLSFSREPMELFQVVANGQSLCGLTIPEVPIGGAYSFSAPEGYILRTILAFNSNTNDLEVYSGDTSLESRFDPNAYSLSQISPVALNSSTPLRLVKAKTFSTGRGPQALALLFTDDQHEGTHRLVLAGLDENRNIVHKTYSWPIGIPSDVILDDINRDWAPEIVVISETSPQAIVFEPAGFLPGAFALPPETPSFVEIGLGARAARQSLSNWFSASSLVIAYPDKKEVRLYQPHSE